MASTRQYYCPFCDRHNPTIDPDQDVLVRTSNILGIRNFAPRQPVSNIFFPVPALGCRNKHPTGLLDVTEEEWWQLLEAQLNWVRSNTTNFLCGGKLTLRLVLNYTSPQAKSPAARQSVEHLHWQMFGLGPAGGHLGRYCTANGYSSDDTDLPQMVLSRMREWSATDYPAMYAHAPVHIIFVPPARCQTALRMDEALALDLLRELQGGLLSRQAAFADGYRVVINIGRAAGQTFPGRPMEVHLLGGNVDLGRYTTDHPTLPDMALVDELNAQLARRAQERGEQYIPSWWGHVTVPAPVR